MRKLVGVAFLLVSLFANGQKKGITFEIESLKKPDYLLRLTAGNKVFKGIILSDLNTNLWKVEKEKKDAAYNIVAQSQLSDSLVTFDNHSFFTGMYHAYSGHRPFVLSPDMIWLLISQGFAQHVTNNSEQLRTYFTKHDGKISLIVKDKDIDLNNPNSPWERVFPEFTKQIGDYTGKDLINTLTCNFTTTTPVSTVASQVTIMEAMKSYFEFIVIEITCGIPSITLEGTPQDWEKVLEKANSLRKYKLDWWVDELEPILKQFVNASKGNVEKGFWQSMFKYHSPEKCGAPNVVDGWIVKFYPYDKTGKRNDLQKIIGTDNLPKEIVKVDLKHIELRFDGSTKTTDLELCAGFVGLQQNKETFALKPEIGWMIRKKDLSNSLILAKLKSDKDVDEFGYSGGINIRVKTVPPEILQLERVKNISIDFVDDIQIPTEMSTMDIDIFRMTGKITDAEIERICKLFPNTELIINEKAYGNRISIRVKTVPPELLFVKRVSNLTIEFIDDIQIPDEMSKMVIGKFRMTGKITDAEIERICKMFPNTELIINEKRIKSLNKF